MNCQVCNMELDPENDPKNYCLIGKFIYCRDCYEEYWRNVDLLRDGYKIKMEKWEGKK